MKTVAIFLIFCFSVSCIGPKILENVGGENDASIGEEYFTISKMLVKNGEGKKVYSGTIRVYRDSIMVFRNPNKLRDPDALGYWERIPNSDIATIYARYTGGGAASALLVLGLAVTFGSLSDRQYSGPNFGKTIGLIMGVVISPVSAGLGALTWNRDEKI